MPPEAVAQVVRGLPKSSDPRLIVGTEGFSDAGVFEVAPDLLLVQSLDFFAPLVDDPYIFGQIAAANSLSDIFAMGATPITALNIVCFPDDKLAAHRSIGRPRARPCFRCWPVFAKRNLPGPAHD